MNDKLADVWSTRDYPILKAATEHIDQGKAPDTDELVKVTGLTPEQIQLGLRALERRGLVEVQWSLGGTGWIGEVSGDAYLVTGLHPDGREAMDALVSTLRQAADRTNDPEERNSLRKAANALGDVSGQVAAGLMTAFLAHMGGFA